MQENAPGFAPRGHFSVFVRALLGLLSPVVLVLVNLLGDVVLLVVDLGALLGRQLAAIERALGLDFLVDGRFLLL